MQPFDLVIRGGTVATATDVMKSDVGIRGSTVVQVTKCPPKPRRRILTRIRVIPKLCSGSLPEVQPFEDFGGQYFRLPTLCQFDHRVDGRPLALGCFDLTLGKSRHVPKRSATV